MANCRSCGGLLKFDIELQKLHCTSCGADFDPYDHDTISSAENNSDYETTVFTCPQCGGELYSTDHDISGNCSFCGSPVVFEEKIINEKRPDYIIPFGITKEECKQIYLKSVGDYPFAPDELSDPEYIEGFRGIYVPYWVYQVTQDGSFSMKASYTEEFGNYSLVYTDDISGVNNSCYDHIMHDASSVLLDDISEKIEPFETVENKNECRRAHGLKPFSTGYFAGFYAEPADVPPETYEEYACRVADEKTRDFISKHGRLGKYKIQSKLKKEQIGSHAQRKKMSMMPVWFLSYRKNDRVAYAAINGQTGRLISDIPIDMKKFWKKYLLTAAIVFLVLMIFTVLPVSVTMISVVMSGLVIRFCHDDVKVLVSRSEDIKRGRLRRAAGDSAFTFIEFIAVLLVILIFKGICLFDNDLVTLVSSSTFFLMCPVFLIAQVVRTIMLYADLAKVKKDKPYMFYFYPLMCLAASLTGTGVLLFSPVNDYYYYFAGVIIICIELIAFNGIIANYNRIATRPLPQFSIHKGGDDNA